MNRVSHRRNVRCDSEPSWTRTLCCGLGLGIFLAVWGDAQAAEEMLPTGIWPHPIREARPWTYWWWMASAVDPANITRELERYHQAGLGGVHIIPIYGAKGFEDKFIDYLSPKWMEMLDHTVQEAGRLGMGVDMTTGSGWCFGGPRVTDEEANATAVCRTFKVTAGEKVSEKFNRAALQALMAFSGESNRVDLLEKLGPDGTLNWSPAEGTWSVYAVSQKPSGQKVKRAGPGGQGHMLNLFYAPGMHHYLEWFDQAFAGYTGAKPRALYHDSYEYRSDWAPDLFASFEKRRGYCLQDELPSLFGKDDFDRAARVKCDYRETLSDLMSDVTLPMWTAWAHERGFITRNEAHGSPGNWLDLYAAADIPETEMFYKDRNKLVSKFASSAAHVTGKQLVASETGTWLNEHFTEALADMKYLLDDLFLSGVNHVFYHGTCYSPDEAVWPGWHFYASYEMNPRNSIWRDVGTLNAYAARCQAVLQAGQPDNDILLYWPIHELWQNASGMARNLTVHARDWFEDQPIGKAAEKLWNRGYAFDYVSDRQLRRVKGAEGRVQIETGEYATVVVPTTRLIPLDTLRRLLEIAQEGGTIIFESQLPQDVPGWGNLDERRAELRRLLRKIELKPVGSDLRRARIEARSNRIGGQLSRGQVFVGDLGAALTAAKVAREPMFDKPGLMCIRRTCSGDGPFFYFVANRSAQEIKGWLTLGRPPQSVRVLNPLTGQDSAAWLRQGENGVAQVYAELEPGESVILRCSTEKASPAGPVAWHQEPVGNPVELTGTWSGSFIDGGPEKPAAFTMDRLASWTTLGDTNAQRFAGTALYRLSFDAPTGPAKEWRLDLGKVCQSARVRLNGQDLGTLITPPFRVAVSSLKPKDNVLEVEVTNVAANRIRDLDRRGVKWKNFYDINVVNLDYKPFDASNWPLADSGLIGPVTLTAMQEAR